MARHPNQASIVTPWEIGGHENETSHGFRRSQGHLDGHATTEGHAEQDGWTLETAPQLDHGFREEGRCKRFIAARSLSEARQVDGQGSQTQRGESLSHTGKDRRFESQRMKCDQRSAFAPFLIVHRDLR